MLPYPRRSFVGYRLLQEYFTFPEKFLFFDLAGLSQLRAAGFGDKVELILFISPFERGERRPMLEASITERTIRLGCTPAVNLFRADVGADLAHAAPARVPGRARRAAAAVGVESFRWTMC